MVEYKKNMERYREIRRKKYIHKDRVCVINWEETNF